MSKSKDILTIDFDRATQGLESHYTDGDIVILKNVGDLTQDKSYIFEMVLIAFCEKGKVQMDINETTHSLTVGDFVILPPKTIVENIMVSTDLEFKAVGISYEAAQRNIHIGKDAWDILHYITQNPILHIEPSAIKLIRTYYELLEQKMQDKNEIYYKEVMLSLYNCLYYELCSVILPLAKDTNIDENMTQGGQICKRFFELLANSEGGERSVTELANKLCITPKYLSTVVKAASGKTALNWIHLYTMKIIERQLKYTDKSIKEIANDLNFSNISFFGKFVKTHTGMSPTMLRRKGTAKSEDLRTYNDSTKAES